MKIFVEKFLSTKYFVDLCVVQLKIDCYAETDGV
jgi:hypothetical protein